jgi:hypothetical protein
MIATAPPDGDTRIDPYAQDFVHQLYGLTIRSPWPLINVPRSEAGTWQVEIAEGDSETFAAAASHLPRDRKSGWYQSTGLSDGSVFCRWHGLFEFIISPDARRILVRCHRHANEEGLQAYLLTQALSFSIVQLGREPLHATAILTGRGAIAFMGESGFGKSTLGALMVAAGYPLVTDDMLVLNRTGEGFTAEPGPPRLKLYRSVAEQIFGDRCRGIPMNPTTEKLIVPMAGVQVAVGPAPLRALYLIGEPGRFTDSHPSIDKMSPGDAFPIILGATLNNWIVDPARLQRQFRFATGLVRTVPVRRLSYLRDRSQFSMLRDAILEDVSDLG